MGFIHSCMRVFETRLATFPEIIWKNKCIPGQIALSRPPGTCNRERRWILGMTGDFRKGSWRSGQKDMRQLFQCWQLFMCLLDVFFFFVKGSFLVYMTPYGITSGHSEGEWNEWVGHHCSLGILLDSVESFVSELKFSNGLVTDLPSWNHFRNMGVRRFMTDMLVYDMMRQWLSWFAIRITTGLGVADF